MFTEHEHVSCTYKKKVAGKLKIGNICDLFVDLSQLLRTQQFVFLQSCECLTSFLFHIPYTVPVQLLYKSFLILVIAHPGLKTGLIHGTCGDVQQTSTYLAY